MEKEKKNNRKILAIMIITLLSLAFIAGAWYFIIQGGLTATVDSLGSRKEITLSFEDMSLNTSTGSSFDNSSMKFVYNRAGNFSVTIIETIGDNSGGECTNAEGDCITNYLLKDGISPQKISNGQYVYIPENNGLKSIDINITCVAYSCPQTRTYLIKLEEVELS